MLAELRTSYTQRTLDRSDLVENPFIQFGRWFEDVKQTTIIEPNAMILATVSADHIPSARTVLLKGIDHGFCFYTNYESEKGEAIAATGVAALVFYWDQLQRQVRIVGKAEKMTRAESEVYFQSRPRGSQIGAWSSPQSRAVPDRATLDQLQKEIELRFAGVEMLPLPPFWGGFRLIPDSIEFWQGRTNRLHDRFRYVRGAEGWVITRLAP